MTVHRYVDFFYSLDVFNDVGNKLAVFVGHGITHRIGNIDRSRARFNRLPQHLAQKIGVASRSVLGGKLDVVAQRFGIRHSVISALKHLFARHFKLVFHMYVAGRQKNVNTRLDGVLNRLVSDFYVLVERARKRSHRRVSDDAGNAFDRLEIPRRRDCEARLDDVHAQSVKLLRHAEFFAHVHAAAGRLLAVP